MKLEVVVIPVSDVDRAKAFYAGLGWRLDADFPFDNGFRVVQFTPPGSGCSVQFGTKMTSAAPGSAQGTYLVVSDIEAAREALVGRGVEVSEVFHAGRRAAESSAVARAGAGRTAQLPLVRDLQRPGRQQLAAPGDHDAAARPDRRRRDGLRLDVGSGERAPARGGGAWRAREAHRRGRRELARLVRGVHAGGAGRH